SNSIADESITSSDLATDSVQATEIADSSIDSGEIVDNSLFASDLAPNSVGTSEITDGSVTGADVTNGSLTLSDLVGAHVTGAIGFSLGAGNCGTLDMSVSGAQVGQAVLFSFTGTAPPRGFLLSPLRVSATNTVTGIGCNVSGSAMSVTNIGVRIITFG
ncbi:MAG: hypothetical protein JO246_06210, partial [Frankiaceae bacterium]|nr:hypothetical protein [Frankiaceae bacterium]